MQIAEVFSNNKTQLVYLQTKLYVEGISRDILGVGTSQIIESDLSALEVHK